MSGADLSPQADSVGDQIAKPSIETLSKVILHDFASCGRITAKPEVTPKSGSVRIGDDPPGTQKGASFPLDECIGLLESINNHACAAHWRLADSSRTKYLKMLILFRSQNRYLGKFTEILALPPKSAVLSSTI
jgi:hypothetical protein